MLKDILVIVGGAALVSLMTAPVQASPSAPGAPSVNVEEAGPAAGKQAAAAKPPAPAKPKEETASTKIEPAPAGAKGPTVNPMKGQPINIKVEAVISDVRSSAEPIKKTLTL